MPATLTNFVPFALAVLDTAALLVVLVFIGRGLVLAILGRPAWKTVLITTSLYVLWANTLLDFGLTGFNPSAYVIILTDLAWRGATGSTRALPSALRLRVSSWVVVSLVPTLATVAVERVALLVRKVAPDSRARNERQ